MIVGVDNGSSSGGATLLKMDGTIIEYFPLPSISRGKRSELDVEKFISKIQVHGAPCRIGVEEPLHHAPFSQSMRSMALCYGQLKGLSIALGWEFIDVGVHQWQKKILGNFPKGKSKQYALTTAKKLAPEEEWLDPTKPRARTAHMGIVDSYLIGYYTLNEVR